MVVRSKQYVAAAILYVGLLGCSRPAPASAPAKTAPPSAMNSQHDPAPSPPATAAPQELAAIEHTEHGANLVLVDISTGKARSVASVPSDTRWLAWTPDGSRLLYLA